MTDLTEVSSSRYSRARFAGIFACLVTLGLYSTWIGVRFGFDAPPSSTGDELSYDSIAWELSHGHGFSVDYGNAEFRRPYDQAAMSDPALFSIPAARSGPVAYRPPLFPAIFALADLLAGRHFYLIRIFNVLCMSATAGIVAWFLYREFGGLAFVFAMLLWWIDVRTRLYARAILTEPLACLLFAVMAVLTVKLARCSRIHRATVVGLAVVTGLSILTRSIVIVWLPGMTLMLWFLFRRCHIAACREVAFHCGLFLLVTLLTISPWAIRNVRLLGKFAPMGTQGQMEMSAGYSDLAWQNKGVWQNLVVENFYADVQQSELTTIDSELARAVISTSRALEWIKANPLKLVPLAAMKVFSELKPRSFVEWILLLLSSAGLYACLDRRLIAVLFALLLINLSAVALTWSVEGRFLVPQLFVFYVLAGAGLHSITQWFRSSPECTSS